MTLNESTTSEELSSFILESTDEEINEVMSNSNANNYMKMMSDEAYAKYKKILVSRYEGAIDAIIEVMKKGNYENL